MKAKQKKTKRTSGRVNVPALKGEVGDGWLDLLRTLAPELDEACEEFPEHVRCPMHGGRDGFRLFDDAETTGGGICNTCGAFSDGIKLLMEVNNWDFKKTVRHIQEYLDDVYDPDADEGEDEPTPARSPVRLTSRAAEQEMNEWGVRYLEDVLARAESGHERLTAYYRHRGLSVIPGPALGFLASVSYYDEDTGRVELPAMLAIFQNAEGDPVAVFKTYLDPNGAGKAPVPTPKKCTPPVRKGATMGAAIRLYEPVDGVLALAEGIETAEAVFQATGTPSWATCAANRLEKVDIPAGVYEVQIWADNDESGTGQRAAGKLAERVTALGKTAKVMLPLEVGTDWLDVLVAKGEEALREALAAATVHMPTLPVPVSKAVIPVAPRRQFGGLPDRKGDPVDELNKRHFLVSIGGKMYVATEKVKPGTTYLTFEFSRVADFHVRYKNWQVEVNKGEFLPASMVWLSSPDRREYEGLVFSPGEDVPGYCNLWQGFAVQPVRGDCGLFWEHVREVICDGDEDIYTYVRKWLAHTVQRPGELPGVALVIRGIEGGGKNFFADGVGKLFGLHYMMLTRMDQLTGRFSGHLKDLLLVGANEAIWGGDKQGEGVLKSMVTDPWCTVEEKGKDIYQVRNYKRLIITTNERWAVPMSMSDRRFLVLETSDVHREDKTYFATLAKHMDEGGTQALLYDLLHEDLEGFDVRTKPKSRHGFDIKLRSADPVVRWWFEFLYRGVFACSNDDLDEGDWNRTPSKNVMHSDFVTYCGTHRLRTIDKPAFSKELKRMMPGCTVGSSRPRHGDTRDRCYTLPSLQECRQAFQRFASAGPEIWDDQQDDD